MKTHLKAIPNSYSEILFMQNIATGLVMLVMTLINFNVGIAGLLSVFSAYLFAKLIHMDNEFINSGFYTYNPLLVGLSIGFLFRLTPLTIFYVIAMGIFTFVLTIMLSHIFSTYFKLPILSLPFVLVSSIAYLASASYSNLYVLGHYPHAVSGIEMYFPMWVVSFFKALGAIFFSPNVIAGILLSILILINSRILFMLAIVGYFSGTLVRAFMVGSFPLAFANINGFNFILIAMAIGGIFLIPSIRSYIVALIAVMISAVFLDSVVVFWSYYGIPAFTLPFLVMTMSFVYVLGLMNFPLVAKFIKATPEDTLDFYLANRLRYKGSPRTLFLPFSGKWTVWQGFNGKWTHKGNWKYAYDFVITGEENKTHRNGGERLADYYAYKKPILSPICGRVVNVISNLPDNEVGQVDKDNNWGNLIVIQPDSKDFYVAICHFAQDSIRLKEGDWVERGTYLGLCGNSGYSPQPHIHIQVQTKEEMEGYTLPFSFVSYVSDNQFHANDLPEEEEIVEPLYHDKAYDIKTSFVLDDSYTYDVFKNEKKVDELSFTVKMALDGTFYFDSGKGRLYFGKHEGTFYFYRFDGSDKYLKNIYLALPRLPLSYKENLEWEDYFPIGLVSKGLNKIVIQFLCSFYQDIAKIKSKSTFIGKDEIKGFILSKTFKLEQNVTVKLDQHTGFEYIKVGDIELQKK